MNFSFTDSFLGQQRCRQWTPLVTQQNRLRHLYRIIAYNVVSEGPGNFYYTLHLTALCAPFYTSEKVDSANPKWSDIDITCIPNSAATACVLRIWQTCENDDDTIVLTWGINFSGLVHLGSKLSDIQPSSFKHNSVILQLRGGFFTSIATLRPDLQTYLPFIDHVNVISTEDSTKVFRSVAIKCPSNDVRKSYNVEKLRRLQSLQMSMRNKNFDAQILRDKINQKCALCITDVVESPKSPTPTSSNSSIRYTTPLLTMNSLNKMLHEKPTKVQKQEIVRISKELEVAKFRTKMLSQEKFNKKYGHIRDLKEKYTILADENELRESQLMENYRQLCKDMEKLRECKKEQIHHREVLLNCCMQLQHRRRQLMKQLLFLYPIEFNAQGKHKINGVCLPNSDSFQDYSHNSLPVALGFVAHVLVMSASFLQVPLRYPIEHMGSRSVIIDHITASVGDTKREYTLYLRGKERFQFNYAVCLLNKNIAQMRWLCGLQTENLKATLPNLLGLLQGDSSKAEASYAKRKLNMDSAVSQGDEQLNVKTVENGHGKDVKQASHAESQKPRKSGSVCSSGSGSVPFSMNCFGSSSNFSDPILDTLRHECQLERSCSTIKSVKKSVSKNMKCNETGPGLSQILAIPEAFLNQQISSHSFKNYVTSYNRLDHSRHSAEAHLESNIKECRVYNDAMKRTNSDSNCDISDGNYSSSTKSNILNLENIEQGTDLLDPSSHLQLETVSDFSATPIDCIRCSSSINNKSIKQKRRISRSVGSYTDEDRLELRGNHELGSDPLLNTTDASSSSKSYDVVDLPSSAEDGQQNFIKQWLDHKVDCTDANVYPEDNLPNSCTVQDADYSPLTLRTDALLNTTSFNLVKPKF